MPNLAYALIDNNWPNDTKVKRLQRKQPSDWPTYWAAYMAAVADAWAHQCRTRPFIDACPVALQVDPDLAVEVLKAVGLLDENGHIQEATWTEWFGPVAAKLDRAKAAADKRWGNANAQQMHSAGNAPAMPKDRKDSKDNNGMSKQPTPGREKRDRPGGKPTRLRDLLTPPPGYDSREGNDGEQ